MAERSKKNLYLAQFKHKKDSSVTELQVIATSFDDAVKKAQENTELVMTGKDDAVEMVGIEIEAVIDVE